MEGRYTYRFSEGQAGCVLDIASTCGGLSFLTNRVVS